MCHNQAMHKLLDIWRRVQAFSSWFILAAAIICAVISIQALRQNNLTMVKLRDEVVKADEQNGDIETALRNLRQYVYAHMNTNVASGAFAIKPPIQLKYHYDRLVAAERQRVTDVNARVYTEAQAECEKRFPAGQSGRGRIPCVEEYVSAHGTKEQPIPDSLYKFDFISPKWSPDLAGWSLLASAVLFLWWALRLVADRWFIHRQKAQL